MSYMARLNSGLAAELGGRDAGHDGNLLVWDSLSESVPC